MHGPARKQCRLVGAILARPNLVRGHVGRRRAVAVDRLLGRHAKDVARLILDLFGEAVEWRGGNVRLALGSLHPLEVLERVEKVVAVVAYLAVTVVGHVANIGRGALRR